METTKLLLIGCVSDLKSSIVKQLEAIGLEDIEIIEAQDVDEAEKINKKCNPDFVVFFCPKSKKLLFMAKEDAPVRPINIRKKETKKFNAYKRSDN